MSNNELLYKEPLHLKYGRKTVITLGIIYIISGIIIGYGGFSYILSFNTIPFLLGMWLTVIACMFIFTGLWSVSYLKKDMDELRIFSDGIWLPRRTVKDLLLMRGPYISFSDISAVYLNDKDAGLPYILIIHKELGPISLQKRSYKILFSNPKQIRKLFPMDIPIVKNVNLTYWDARKNLKHKHTTKEWPCKEAP